MGYSTYYSLQIQPHTNFLKEVNLDSVIEAVENENISQEDLVKYLRLIKKDPLAKSVEVKEDVYSIIERFRDQYDEAAYSIDGSGGSQDESKWYDHQEDLKAFSQKYPQHLFILKGKGEESGDIWMKYFLNGKVQVANAVITFEEFNEAKLK